MDFVVDVVSPVAAGLEDIDTSVTVTAPGDTNPANDTDIETTPLDASPDVAVTIDDAGVTANSGAPITYTVSVTNVGDQGVGSSRLRCRFDDGGVTATAGNPVAYTVSVTNVGDQGVGSFSLSQLVPVGTTFNAAGSPGWTCVPDDTAGSTCTFTGGPLAGGGGTTDVDFVVDVVSPVPAGLEDIDTAVTVTAPGDTNPANDTDIETTPLDASPDVAVTIDDGGVTATAGESDRVHGVGDQCW